MACHLKIIKYSCNLIDFHGIKLTAANARTWIENLTINGFAAAIKNFKRS